MANQSTKEIQKTVYVPDSQMRSPIKLIKDMWQDVRASRELSWRLFRRDLSAQYRQSIAGVLWAFIPPLATSLVFILLRSNNVINIAETDIPYPAFVLVGTILWQIFSESLNAPLKTVTASKMLLAKINFPREALIISAMFLVIFNLIIKIIVMVGIFFFFKIQISFYGLLLAPISIMMIVLLGICIGLLITPLGMLYNDVATAIPVGLLFLFFLTPVVYPPPETFPFSLFVKLNPVSPLIVGARDLLTTGSITNLTGFIIVSVLTLIFLVIAWIMYRISLPIIIERISA